MTNRKAPVNKLPEGIAAMRKLYRNYRNAAIYRGYSFELTEEQFSRLTQADCFYCGRKPTQVLSAKNGMKQGYSLNGDYTHNGIDRMDNDQGYTLENSIACCKISNRAKQAMDMDDFIAWIQDLVNHTLTRYDK